MHCVPTDFADPAYLRALTHSLCVGACGEAYARLPFFVSRRSRSGAHLPNLSVCADCLGDVLHDCLGRRETPTVFRTCDARADGGEGLHPAPPSLPPAPAPVSFQGDLFALPDTPPDQTLPDKETRQ